MRTGSRPRDDDDFNIAFGTAFPRVTMKRTRRFLPVVWLFAALAAADAQDSQYYNCATNADNTITIVGYSGPGGDVSIPTNLFGLPVTCIGAQAFSSASLTNLTIPGGVASIGDYSFLSCSNLVSVTIPGSVTNIGDAAFAYCASLTSVLIPASVASIGPDAFADCSSLTSVAIPDSVTNFQDQFSGCSNLTTATLDDGVASLPDDTFEYCPSLTNIVVPCSVTNIGLDAVQFCYGLRAISVDGANAFYGSLDGVLYDKSQTVLLYYPQGLAGNYTIPSGVANVGDSAFAWGTNLTGVTIPGSVTNIGANAFRDCVCLTNASIAGGVASIGYQAFLECFSLAGVMIPGTVTNIGAGAFGSCVGVTSFLVDAANLYYSSVNGVLFDKGQSTLLAFPGGCGGSYTVSNGVTAIGDTAFLFCTNLTSITIPNSVTSIGVGAFELDLSLAIATIGNGVTNIGDGAFQECGQLAGVYFSGNAPAFDLSVFEYDPVTLYYLPGTTGWSDIPAGLPAALWNPVIQTGDGGFGVQDGQFGFNITGTANIPVVVEVCANLANPLWSPLRAVTLTNGWFHFNEPMPANSPARFYGLGLP
jgi:hypothetical protein